MTGITPAAVNAREEARLDDGKFGEQHHTAPEAHLFAERPLSHVLDLLQYEYGADAAMLDRQVLDVRIEAFVAEAREAVPDAVAAQFSWSYDENGSRLVLDYYLGEGGAVIEGDGYPDIFDFAFTDDREARMYGFEEQGEEDSAVLNFDTVTVRDEAKARADYAASTKLRRTEREREVKSLVRAALAAGADPARIEQLSDEDAAAVLAIFKDAIAKTTEYFTQD